MGLGASAWSDDLDEASRIARQYDTGRVWVKTMLSWIAMRLSGVTREVELDMSAGLAASNRSATVEPCSSEDNILIRQPSYIPL